MFPTGPNLLGGNLCSARPQLAGSDHPYSSRVDFLLLRRNPHSIIAPWVI